MTQIDYLAIGHVSKDLTADGYLLGGTVSFSSQVAVAMGYRTAVYTSASSDMDLSTALAGVDLHCISAEKATTFTNTYTTVGRMQTIESRAARLTTTDLPSDWQRAAIAHLAPVADEVDSDLINLFSNSVIGITPQGWMRQWDEEGHVFPKHWGQAEQVLPLATAVIIGEDDFHDPAILTEFKQWAKLLVLTQGAKGCTVFMDDETRHFPAPSITGHIETTGAGDTFATAFFLRLYQTDGNAWESARFANEIAAQSVTQPNIAAKTAAIQSYLKELTS